MEWINQNQGRQQIDPVDYIFDNDQLESNTSVVLGDDNFTFDSNQLSDIIKEDFFLNHFPSSDLESAISAALIATNEGQINNDFTIETLTMSTLNTPEVRSDDVQSLWKNSSAFDANHCTPTHSVNQSENDDAFNHDDFIDDNLTSLETMQLTSPFDSDFLLPMNEVDEILAQLETPSPTFYSVTDIQPITELHGDSAHTMHDHNYCITNENVFISEFLDVSSEVTTESNVNMQVDSPFIDCDRKARRRELNNEACKRSRQRRKMTLHEKRAECKTLESRNIVLRRQARHLEKMRDEWKRRLMDMVAS